MTGKCKEIHLKGTPISCGIAIGKAFFFATEEEPIPVFQISHDAVESEVLRYHQAINRGCDELNQLRKQLKKEKISEGVAILDSYLQMMKDPLLTDNVTDEIRATCRNAEDVFHATIKKYQQSFNSLVDPFFRERFRDIEDVSRRILRFLKESFRVSLAKTPKDSVIFSRDLTASDVAEANISRVSAFVTFSGGVTSHTAIVAKAKGIPYVTNVFLQKDDLANASLTIVDGRTGDIFLNPHPDTVKKYLLLKMLAEKHLAQLHSPSRLTAETYDGYAIKLSANIERREEIRQIHDYGSHGVGLYRSEYEFLLSEHFPTEEEQFRVYKSVVEQMNGLPIVIRTFDIGGDKLMLSRPIVKEANPIMGCRAIRFFLQESEIFKWQLRAILRASAYGNISILFPMVSVLSELIEAKKLLEEAKRDLSERGEPFASDIPIGCMIEVPSAAIIADLLANECDFLSIGTNDLIQYSLAVDRNNQHLSSLYAPTHPSILRLIKLVIQEANHQGISVSVCGEIAADPRFTLLLIGLGVHELSVAPRHLPIIKEAIRSASIVEATALAEKVMSMASPGDILELLTKEYQRLVPSDHHYT